jgi:hypothetical protein
MTDRRLAFAGLAGAPLFAVLVCLATALEWDFLHDLGWSAAPFDSPDPPWPSSAALGNWGALVVAAFLVLGGSMVALAVALLDGRKVGPPLLALAGAGAALAAFRTDYGSAGGGGPETWNGTLHAVGLTVFTPVVVLAMLARRSLLAGPAALASLIAFLVLRCSVFFWVFLAVVVTWLALTSAQLLAPRRA